jgi:ribonucleotide monophosphatase NagD (HAD superfamily)
MTDILFAFDVDGTLETSNGPITIAELEHLQSLGAAVVIVSESSKAPSNFERFINRGSDGPDKAYPSRQANLLAAKAAFPSKFNFYVSDNEDYESAMTAGFTYIDAKRLTVESYTSTKAELI